MAAPEHVPAGRRRSGRSPRYLRSEILDRIRAWNAEHGSPPTMADWEPARARRSGQLWRVERFRAGEWPTVRMVCAQFPSFNAAITEAGLAPNRRTTRRWDDRPADEAVLEAIRQWTRRYGEPPTRADWDPACARRLGQEWRTARFHSEEWPSLSTVEYHFGTLNAACLAAGLPARPSASGGAAAAIYREHARQGLARKLASDAGHAGRDDLGRALRIVVASQNDPERLHAALVDLATVALRWAAHPEPSSPTVAATTREPARA